MRRVREASARQGTVKMKIALVLMICVGMLAGCDVDRMTRLEKENGDLKAKVARQDTAMNYDLQAKCSKDARAWFNQNWSRNKNTILLDFTNHYSKSQNSCFIEVEHHWNEATFIKGNSSWTNHITLWNAYENSQYAEFSESHYLNFKDPPIENVLACSVYGQKCTSIDQFNNLASHYMSD